MLTMFSQSFHIRHFAIVAIVIILGPIVSEAFLPQLKQFTQPSTFRVHPFQGWDGTSRFDGSVPLVNLGTSNRDKAAGQLFAFNPPDTSSLSTYFESTFTSNVPYSVSWGICLAISVIYAISILTTKEGEPKAWQLECQDGFCLTGYGEGGKYLNPDIIGPNSHRLSYKADLVFTALALVLPLLSIVGVPIPNIGSYPFDPKIDIVISCVLLILFHGLLHNYLADFYEPPKDVVENGDTGIPEGNTFFVLFSTILVAACIAGFSSVPYLLKGLGLGLPALGGVIAVLTGIVYYITMQATKKGLGISAFFMSTQVLVSFVGFVFPDDVQSDPLMAWTFGFTCLVSLIEYYSCEKFLSSKGGHMWYDIALHTSLLTGYWLSDSVISQVGGIATKLAS